MLKLKINNKQNQSFIFIILVLLTFLIGLKSRPQEGYSEFIHLTKQSELTYQFLISQILFCILRISILNLHPITSFPQQKMKELQNIIKKVPELQEEEGPFEIIRNHRAEELRKRRKLLRKFHKERNQKNNLNNFGYMGCQNSKMHKSMQDQESLWEVLVEGTLDFKKEEESFSTQLQSNSSIDLARKYVEQLPSIEKKQLFSQTFEQIQLQIFM